MAKALKVYWAPDYGVDRIDWNMLYADPISVFDKSYKQKTNVDKYDSVFYCPAFKHLAKNTLEFNNPLTSTFEFDNNGQMIPPTTRQGVFANVVRQPNLHDQILLEYGLRFVFFTDDDSLDCTLTAPWFNNSPWQKTATMIPGRYDIGKWFRAVNVEFMLDPGVKKFTIKEDEPLCYFSFGTDRPIEFIRFKMNDALKSYSIACSSSTTWNSWIPLADRYKKFKNSRMKSLILKEIKRGIIDG
ncbi:MAG: hypothetical protein CMO44_15045 [Verrucomicrobiales bacterium]|nr:hypothetical protein [Verrucomicrobiales bacterium]|tara:strand:+ start:5257 stop:5985 length:729 start_codon:yes stop_codon:yes gene_type:complete